MPHRGITGDDVVENQRFDAAILRHPADLADFGVDGVEMLDECIRHPTFGEYVDPDLVDYLMHEDVRTPCQFFQIAAGIGARIAGDHHGTVWRIEAVSKGGKDLMMVDQSGPDTDVRIGVPVNLEWIHRRARGRVRVDEIGIALLAWIEQAALRQRYADVAVRCPPNILRFDEGREIDPAIIQGEVIDRLCKRLQEQTCHLLCSGRRRTTGCLDDRPVVARFIFFQLPAISGTQHG